MGEGHIKGKTYSQQYVKIFMAKIMLIFHFSNMLVLHLSNIVEEEVLNQEQWNSFRGTGSQND